ncbi:putative nuclease HARBI1 [Dermacentor andersoni]|uniref:putative nuclease HARBI1 n=1 Tax=Dermacentor andersoni TaxID=34620 RepID=UPI0024177410|nr:putative nuclease HARBI1 [Dermacentor andersoni]
MKKMAAPLIAMAVALRRRRREQGEPDDAFDMPDDHFRRRFRLSKGTVRLLCEELAGELEAERATGLSVERKVLCALRFFATGSFQASVGSEETIRVSQSTVSECVRRVAEAVVNAGARNKWVHFPKTAEEKAAVKEGFLRRGVIPGVIGCVDGSLIAIIAPKGERKAVFMCRKGYYALNCMFICDADMKILALDPMRPGSDHDAFVWRTTWLRRRFQAGRIVNAGEYLLGDSGYPLEPWLLTPVPGHPPVHTAEGQYNTAHAAMRSVVERCIGLLKSRFRCLQRYRTLLYEPERAANIVAACAVFHNLRLSEGDESGDDSDDDSSSSSSSSELDNNGDPTPHSLPRNTGSRMHYLRGRAVRDNVIGMFGTTRAQHMRYLRSVRRQLRRQQQRQHR